MDIIEGILGVISLDKNNFGDSIPSEEAVPWTAYLKQMLDDLPPRIKELGERKIAGLSLSRRDRTYLNEWRKEEAPAFKEKWGWDMG